jgi:hypothetical protein
MSYKKVWGEKYPQNIEKIFVDVVKDKKLVNRIQDIFCEYLVGYFDATKASSVLGTHEEKYLIKDMENDIYECSKELGKNIPFLGYPNFFEYEKNKLLIIKEQEKKYPNIKQSEVKLWSKYLDYIEGGKNLNSLVEDGMLDCVGQSLLIKQALGKNNFKIYNTKNRSKKEIYNAINFGNEDYRPRTHAFLASRIKGDHYVIIDPAMYSSNFSLVSKNKFWNKSQDADITNF